MEREEAPWSVDHRLAVGLLLLPALGAGCTGSPSTVTVAWVEGHETRDPTTEACEWSPTHRVDPGNRTIHHRPEETPGLAGASRIVAVSVTGDGGCPAAWELHPDPGTVRVETLNVTLRADGTVDVENATHERALDVGDSWEVSYNLSRSLEGNRSITQHRNGSVTIHALGDWPRTGLRPTPDVP